MLKKMAVAMAVAGGLMVAAMPAHAGGHVSLSLGVGLPFPGVYAAPAPAYYGPPAPTYYAPPVVYDAPAPYPVYVGPRYYGYGYRGYYAPRVVYREGWHGGHDGDHGGGWHR